MAALADVRTRFPPLCPTVILTCLLALGFPATGFADDPLTPLIGVGSTSMNFGAIPMGASVYINEELLNAVHDSTSVLDVSEISIQGDGFSLYCPPDSLAIPGDSTVVLLPIRFQATSEEEVTGLLTISASNAPNSPLEVPLSGRGLQVDQVVMGYDRDVPVTCGINYEEPESNPDYDFRMWQCIPSVIRDDGQDSFVLEVDLTNVPGTVTRVTLSDISNRVIPYEPSTIELTEIAPAIFQSIEFTYNSASPMLPYFSNDPNSPSGLEREHLGLITYEKEGGVVRDFTHYVQIFFLDQDILPTTITVHSDEIRSSPHLINLQADSTPWGIWPLSIPARKLAMTAIYEIFPDVADFAAYFGTVRFEQYPNEEGNNVAGTIRKIQVNYTGTGLDPFDDSGDYGSDGRLLGECVLRSGFGVNSEYLTHEIMHQWAAHLPPEVNIGSGGHYYPQASLYSLLHTETEWTEIPGGSFETDCPDCHSVAPALDQYLLGLIDGEDVVVHVDFANGDDCDATIAPPFDVTATIEDIQEEHGIRTPGPAEARRNFVIAFLAPTPYRFFNDTEMTFYEILAEHYTKEITSAPCLERSWAPMTKYFPGTTWLSNFPSAVAGVDDVEQVCGMAPLSLRLLPATPSVFGSLTTIRYEIQTSNPVRLGIYSVTGHLIRELVHSMQSQGKHSVTWDGRDERGRRAAAGIYFCRVAAGGQSLSQSLTLVH